MNALQTVCWKEGYDFALENARNLNKIANLSAANNLFGAGCSLNILSAEEGIKAIYLIIKHYSFEDGDKDFEKLFMSHHMKHTAITELSKDVIPIIEIIYVENWLFNYVYDLLHKRIKALPTKYNPDKILKDIEPFMELLAENKNNSKEMINIDEAEIYWNKANTNKNNGLYVGFQEGSWLTPQTFTHSDFVEANKHAVRIIDCAARMVDACELALTLKSDPSKAVWPTHLKIKPTT